LDDRLAQTVPGVVVMALEQSGTVRQTAVSAGDPGWLGSSQGLPFRAFWFTAVVAHARLYGMQQPEASEKALSKIFCADYDFVIPDYQRPYAWEKEQAAELLNDLTDALDRDEREPYFLGSIVLIKQPDQPWGQVVDGQQRLTTLTILFAVLAHLAADEETAHELRELLIEPGKKLLGLEAKPRLELRPKDAGFFRKYVQAPDRLDDLLALNDNELDSEAQRAIQANTKLIVEELKDWKPERRLALGQLLLQRTYLVVVSTADLASAYRIFNVLNTRGMDLSPADVFKSQVIGAIDENSRNGYARKWEDAEDDLGRGEFADLFGHIRMIVSKQRAKEGLLKEFPDQVLSKYQPGDMRLFIDDELVPYARAYCEIRDANYGLAHAGGDRINAWFRRLVRLDNSDWWPVALWAMRHHRGDPEFLDGFFQRLERLAASMLIRRIYTTPRVERYTRLLTELDDCGLDAPSFDLDPAEIAGTVELLDRDLYLATRVRMYVLLRLDELLAAADGPLFAHKRITIEHVLPQNPESGSEWCGAFSPAQRVEWTHRLANLVLLNRTKNPQASRHDFAMKKLKYFSGPSGVATFALTVQVLGTAEWTPDTLKNRQTDLLNKLTAEWKLGSFASLPRQRT
jgi:hypothetical protein